MKAPWLLRMGEPALAALRNLSPRYREVLQLARGT